MPFLKVPWTPTMVLPWTCWGLTDPALRGWHPAPRLSSAAFYTFTTIYAKNFGFITYSFILYILTKLECHICLTDVHLNGMKCFQLLILVVGSLVFVIDWMIFFVTIPRCYNDVNSFFPCATAPWIFLPAECFPLTYDLNGWSLSL